MEETFNRLTGQPEVSTAAAAFNTDNADSEGRKVLHYALGAAIIMLNGLCLAAMARGRLYNEANKFLFMGSLASINIPLGLLQITDNLPESTNFSAFNDTIYCYINNTVGHLGVCIQVFSLLLLTIDQYVQIEKPLMYTVYATRKKAYLALTVVSGMGVLNVAMAYIIWETNGTGCQYAFAMPIWYLAYYIGFMMALPLSCIITVHVRIMGIAWKQAKKIASFQLSTYSAEGTTATGIQLSRRGTAEGAQHISQLQSEANPSRRTVKHPAHLRAQLRSVLTISVMVGTFVCCWLPSTVAVSLAKFHPGMVPLDILRVTSFVYSCNYLITPLIYIVRLKEVKREIRKMCRCSAH